MKRIGLVMIALLTVSACATGPRAGTKLEPGVTRTGGLTTTVRSEGSFKAPSVQNIAGVSGLIGAGPDRLTRHFGDARLDLSEGDARKLQFASDQCVLDVFLYPLEPGATPTATYVEARDPANGAKVDEASCIRQLGSR